MIFDPFKKRVIPPIKSLEERLAREKGIYPNTGEGWDIPFRIWYKREWFVGNLIPNHIRLMIGVPGTFLVFWDVRFRGTISWTSDGWIMERTDPYLVATLGEWIELWYM